ncbi:MAG: hypothetical protein JNM27_11275 [Leptospirales bacterium]|nr:hypothetical protein [Leptospirales bacterium]
MRTLSAQLIKFSDAMFRFRARFTVVRDAIQLTSASKGFWIEKNGGVAQMNAI